MYDSGDINFKFKGLFDYVFLMKLKWWIFERTKKKGFFFYEDDEGWRMLYEDENSKIN